MLDLQPLFAMVRDPQLTSIPHMRVVLLVANLGRSALMLLKVRKRTMMRKAMRRAQAYDWGAQMLDHPPVGSR
jgi:hypothetical protein